MALWYLDVVTEGDDPHKHRVLSIQYQRLLGGEPTGPFQVLAEWEWGEKQILRSFLEKGALDPMSDFVPVGRRTRFDLAFLMEKAQKYGLKKWSVDEALTFWRTKPMVDLGSLSSGTNGEEPEGRAVPSSGRSQIPELYLSGKFGAILDLVATEKEETFVRFRRLHRALSEDGGPR